MTTAEIKAMATKYIINTYGDRKLALVRGEGPYVWDADGAKYLDFLGGLAVNGLGHCHPNVVSAIREQAGELLHVFQSLLYRTASEAGEAVDRQLRYEPVLLLQQRRGIQRVRNQAGAEVCQRSGRTDAHEIITMENSFHGRTMATITATAQTRYHAGFEPMVPGFKYVPFDDLPAVEAVIDEKTCAILVEPIQSEGGVNVPSDGYLEGLREICDKHNLLLIFDEVQTAMGRLGTLFGYQSYEVVPDVITMAKFLGGGVPIGAMLAKKHIAESFVPGTHAATFGGNPLVTAAAYATLRTVIDENLGENAVKIGAYLTEKLMNLKEKYPIKEVRGRGLLLGLVMAVDANALAAQCIENGLITICTNNYVLRFLPPINIEAKHVDEAVSIVEKSLADTA